MEKTDHLEDHEVEIDLRQLASLLIKGSRAFFIVFFCVVALGVWHILSSPKIYRISTLLQLPISREVFPEASDLESAENLKGLIINGAFEEALGRKLGADLGRDRIVFRVTIPDKTSMLQISIDVEEARKGSGIATLESLFAVISESYAKRFEVVIADIDRQIKFNERAIESAKEKSKAIEMKLQESAAQGVRLREEISVISAHTTEVLGQTGDLLGGARPVDNASTLLMTGFVQNSLSYSNQLSGQLSSILVRESDMGLELKSIVSQMNDLQAMIDKLGASKASISSLRILSPPRVSLDPVAPNAKKVLSMSLAMGLFFGVVAALLSGSRTAGSRRVS